MQIGKKILAVVGVAPLLAGLSGCAGNLIEVRDGAEKVSLLEANQVAGCQSRGGTTVSVLAEVGFYNRSVEAVEADLLQLARNVAVDSGGDTLVRGRAEKYGTRAFDIYKCRK